ncbi:MAG TPA: tetratricopeptide repeat protein [Candidatus Eisenbacteria bacterium]
MPVRPAPRRIRPLPLAALCLLVGCSSSHPKAAPAGPGGDSAPGVKAGASATAPARGHVEAGNDFMTRGRFDDAEREFRLALEAEPGNLEAVAGLGQVQVRRGEYSDAVPLLERATRVSTQMVSAFRSLGDAYAALGDLEKAAVAYRQAVALAPSDLNVRLALAHSLTEIGEYGEAAGICTTALRVFRGQADAQARVMSQLGEVYAREGKVAESMSAYYKASELNPRDVETTRGAASAAVRGGLYAEAASALDRLLQISPLDVDAKKQLAWVNFKLERYPNAIRDYEAVGDSLGTADRYYLAQAYAKSNKVDRAIELFREVVRLDPENYKGVYCNMAYAYYDATRYNRAIEMAKEGLAGDSASTCLKFCWAQALDKLGRHEEAIPMFEAVLSDPAYAESAQRELERQKRIVRLLKTKDRGN